MSKNPFSQLLSVLLLIALALGVVLFVFPMQDRIETAKAEKALMAAELQQVQSQFDSLTAISGSIAKSQATKNSLLAAVPKGFGQDEFLEELSAIAKETRFDLSAMSFSESVSTDYGEILNVSVNFSGSFTQLIPLLQKIETADRLMTVRSISVQRTSSDRVVFNLSIEAYYQ
jgi:Tfp pilus assembly protein PilO